MSSFKDPLDEDVIDREIASRKRSQAKRRKFPKPENVTIKSINDNDRGLGDDNRLYTWDWEDASWYLHMQPSMTD